MLEESVLKRWSQVHLLSDEAEIDAGARATAIFPDLRDDGYAARGRDRLLSMMEWAAHLTRRHLACPVSP